MANPFQIALAPSQRGTPPVKLDLATLVDTRLLVTGNSGCGKSWVLRLIAEQGSRKVPVIVLDPEGEYASLRDHVDAVLVGEGGELMPDVRTAGKLATKLLELRVSAIIDLQPLKLQERRAFVKAFLDSMMRAPRKLWRECLVLIDEAHRFCPERSAGQSEASESVITLASQGRKRGFCVILASQRLSKLHKDAAAEMVNVMVGRTTLDVDVKRAIDLLGLPAAGKGAIRGLHPGQWFGHGPAFHGQREDGILRFRAGKVKTKHPKAGERASLTAPAPSARIKRVLPELQQLPQKAQEEVRDLEGARREVKELRRQLRTAQRGAPVVDTGRVQALETESKELRATLAQVRRDVANSLKSHEAERKVAARHFAALEKTLAALLPPQLHLEALRAFLSEAETELELPADPAPASRTQPRPRVQAAPPPEPSSSNGTPLGDGAFGRLLCVLVQHPDGIAKKKAALLSKIPIKSSTLRGVLADLRKAGLEAKEGGALLRPTQQAIDEYGAKVEPLPEGSELRDFYLGEVGRESATGRLLAAAFGAWPNELGKAEAAQIAGIPLGSSTLRGALATLRKLEVINKAPNKLKASDHLFD